MTTRAEALKPRGLLLSVAPRAHPDRLAAPVGERMRGVRGEEKPMRRGARSAKRAVRSERAAARRPVAGDTSKRDELHQRLAEALDQQAATSEILRLISASPAHVQPVFDAIATRALRLCEARFSAVYCFDGELVHLVAHSNFNQRAERSGNEKNALLWRKRLAELLDERERRVA